MTLDDHYNICKKKMEIMIFKIANLASGCEVPSRMVQLFFVILKSVVDYGSVIYTKIKARTTTEKFARLIRVNFKRALRLKMSTPDKVVYEIIGDPLIEWQRRAKQIEKSKEELMIDGEWIKMQEGRKKRGILRKQMYWEAIYMASVPLGIKRVCRKCREEFNFSHIKLHIGEKQNEIIDELEEVIRGKEAIRKMINMNRKKDIIIMWKIYSKLFVNKRTNTMIEEFLEKEIRDDNEFKSGQ